MFAGHIGAALAIARAERRVNVGLFIVAALWLDLVLWVFVLLGWESVAIPADFAATHQAHFVFPYSHGLVASVAWALLAGALTLVVLRRAVGAWRVAVWIEAAVLSHWVLDAIVHRPELPLAGPASPALGLALWQHMAAALALEAALVAIGLWLFVRGSTLSRGHLIALAVLTVLLLAFTIAGMTVAPAPPSPQAMAASSLATLVVVCALAAWLGRRRRAA